MNSTNVSYIERIAWSITIRRETESANNTSIDTRSESSQACQWKDTRDQSFDSPCGEDTRISKEDNERIDQYQQPSRTWGSVGQCSTWNKVADVVSTIEYHSSRYQQYTINDGCVILTCCQCRHHWWQINFQSQPDLDMCYDKMIACEYLYAEDALFVSTILSPLLLQYENSSCSGIYSHRKEAHLTHCSHEQFCINHDEPHSNWSRIEDYIKKAKSQDVDLIVFPE